MSSVDQKSDSRRTTVVSLASGLALIAAGVALFLWAWRAHGPQALRMLVVSDVLAELGILCLWWPLYRSVRAPMGRAASSCLRAFGVLYMLSLLATGVAILAITWGDEGADARAVQWFVAVLVVPLAAAAALFAKPRLLLAWCLGGLLPLLLGLWFLDSRNWDLGEWDCIILLFLGFSGMPVGMLVGLGLAWAGRLIRRLRTT